MAEKPIIPLFPIYGCIAFRNQKLDVTSHFTEVRNVVNHCRIAGRLALQQIPGCQRCWGATESACVATFGVSPLFSRFCAVCKSFHGNRCPDLRFCAAPPPGVLHGVARNGGVVVGVKTLRRSSVGIACAANVVAPHRLWCVRSHIGVVRSHGWALVASRGLRIARHSFGLRIGRHQSHDWTALTRMLGRTSGGSLGWRFRGWFRRTPCMAHSSHRPLHFGMHSGFL